MISSHSENYKKYTSFNPIIKAGVHSFLRAILKLTNSLSPESILDAGCGEGFVARHILTHYHRPATITGIDIDHGILLESRVADPRYNLIQASAYQMPFRDKSFDLVICLEVLEHLTLVDAALAELKRVSGKDCIISLPHEPYFSICRALGGRNMLRLGRHPGHVSCFKISDMKEKLKHYFELKKTITSFPWIIFWLSAK